MEIKIGISDVPRDVTIETEATAKEITARLTEALEKQSLFEVSDAKGRRVVVPAAKIAYLDLGAPSARPVGFGTV
ncbi:MAG TPA: DUF3107 domain-containing protein [Arachnia sp.]|nr:DUF3107 domain-containing protein [Arachnia sp.]HMT87248.1 DUF3107 domain-containing protein [Arachnia sp.]